MKYWHALSVKEFDELSQVPMSWGDVVEYYKQPEWCKYPEALNGLFGCWSLISSTYRQHVCESHCEHCDMFNPCWRQQELLEE